MWPSITATRLVCALTIAGCGVRPPSAPRIFSVSLSIFSSSPLMNGTTLPRMSSEGTPGYPAPDTACIVETTTRLQCRTARSGASAIASTTVEQLGFVTIAPFQPLASALFGDQIEMVGVDLRDQQRHQRIHAVVARVADDDVAGGREGVLDFAGDRGVECREDDARAAAGRARLDANRRELVRHRRRQPPRCDIAVRPSFGSFAGGEPGRAKPRVAREAGHKLLTDDAGRAEHAHLDGPHPLTIA